MKHPGSSSKKDPNRSNNRKKGLFRKLTIKGDDDPAEIDIARRILSDPDLGQDIKLKMERSKTETDTAESISTAPSDDSFKSIENQNLNSSNHSFDRVLVDDVDNRIDDSAWVGQVASNSALSPDRNTRNERDQVVDNEQRIYSEQDLQDLLAAEIAKSLEKQMKNIETLSKERDQLAEQVKSMTIQTSPQKQPKDESHDLSRVKQADLEARIEKLETEKAYILSSSQETHGQLQKQIQQLRDQIMNQESANESKISKQSLLQQEDYERQLEDFRTELLLQKEKYEEKLRSQQEVLTKEITSRITQTLTQQKDYLQNRINDMENDTQTQIANVRDEHAAEIEEMIAQLDEVEAEHETRLQEAVQEASSQKEIVITALSAHLAEERRKVDEMSEEHVKFQEMMELAESELKACQEELKIQVQEYEAILQEERQNRIVAERKIEQDMRSAAEKQFKDANKFYLKLKREYDLAEEEIDKLTKDLEENDLMFDSFRKESKGREMKCLAEIADLKAGKNFFIVNLFFNERLGLFANSFLSNVFIHTVLAKAEASRARLEQEYSSELEASRDMENVLRQKLDEASTNCTQAHMSLATVVNEKEKLEKENKELNSVCEELMMMIEGGNEQK